MMPEKMQAVIKATDGPAVNQHVDNFVLSRQQLLPQIFYLPEKNVVVSQSTIGSNTSWPRAGIPKVTTHKAEAKKEYRQAAGADALKYY